jgi:hypothetical protein
MALGTDAPMKLLIISDIHGNLDALSESYDELWVLGDGLRSEGWQPEFATAWAAMLRGR